MKQQMAEERWGLKDEYIKKLSDPKAKVRIEGKMYFLDPNQEDLVVGDVCLDRGDGTWGVIDFIMPGQNSLHGPNIELQCAIRSEGCIECGVPLRRLVRLQPFPENAN